MHPAVGPDRDTAVVVVNCAVNLRNVPNVKTRTLIARYPTQPHTREFPISSVQATFAGAEVAGPEATEYSVDISIDQTTLDALNDGNFVLYGFKAVKTSAVGAPLVWFQTMQFGLSPVELRAVRAAGRRELRRRGAAARLAADAGVRPEHQAAVHRRAAGVHVMSAVAPGALIDVDFAASIATGQLLTVDHADGSGDVTGDGAPGAVSVLNATNRAFTCGVCEDSGPVCAMPLYGDGLQLIALVPKVFLMFATTPMWPGTAIALSTARAC